MNITLNTKSIADYQRFLQIKQLPVYEFHGREAWFPDEYAHLLGLAWEQKSHTPYTPSEWLFDYQREITALAIRKQKFAIFADCGLGKTFMLLEFARHCVAALPAHRPVLIVSPLMVVSQTIEESNRMYGESLPVQHIRAKDLQAFLSNGRGIGITNYDALTDELTQGSLGALILDESSMLKSMYGKWGQKCIELGKGLAFKLCLTGTPAPNDRIEYGNHAVFLDQFPTLNAFLARYFVNRGQTDNRWELKGHALKPFYRSLSHWCIFLSNPAVYGWSDNCENIPPINVHIHDVDLTKEQEAAVREHTGELFAASMGGITGRSTMSRIGKGKYNGKDLSTHKFDYLKALVDSWPDESTIIWCWYNDEQERIASMFPDCASIEGSTKEAKRLELIADFKAGRRKILVSKPKVLGFGLNLQIATRQVFSSLIDSYESYYQCVKRSNRIGSTRPLNVHIPVTDVERPMVDNVLRKAGRVQADTTEQEAIFKEYRIQ